MTENGRWPHKSPGRRPPALNYSDLPDDDDMLIDQPIPPDIPDSAEISSINYVKQFLADKLSFPPSKIDHSFEYEELVEIGPLGNGSFGTVCHMLHPKTQMHIAVKRIRIINNGTDEGVNKSMQRLRQEVEAAKAASNCDEIVKFYGITFYEGDAWLCMELMDISLDILYRVVHQVVRVPFNETTLGAVAIATIRALEHLKINCRIIHRDVKPSNILLNKRGEIKLCDFGICGYLQDSVAQTRDVGCRPYMAPERLAPNNEGYDIKSDVWSLGVSMVEVANGQFPYPGLAEAPIFVQINMIVHGDPPLLTTTQLSTRMRHFIMACTMKEHNMRADFEELKRSEVYKVYDTPEAKSEVGSSITNLDPID